jgi:hypothetical protein
MLYIANNARVSSISGGVINLSMRPRGAKHRVPVGLLDLPITYNRDSRGVR